MKIRLARITFVALFVVLFSFAARAETIPSILDVQKRGVPFYKWELSPFIGDYMGDIFSHALHAGGHAEFHFTRILSFGLDAGWADAQTALDPNLYTFQGGLTFNLPAAFLSNKHTVIADLFTTIGGGLLRINRSDRADGFIGGGMKIDFEHPAWIALRVEMRNFFSSVPTATGERFTSDLSIMVGPTFSFCSKQGSTKDQ